MFRVVMQHMEARGAVGARGVSTSIAPAAAVLLLARGADSLIIPTPDTHESESAEAGVQALPAERRTMVKLVDRGGEMLRRVRHYLDPLQQQARKWPEDAFVRICEDFLYELVVAEKHQAGIVSDSASVVRGFVPIVDPSRFRGEAAFRLAEVVRLICDYEPGTVEQGLCSADISAGSSSPLWELLEAAEFRELSIASGRIGYLKKPLIGLKRLRSQFVAVARLPNARSALSLVATAADAAGTGTVGKRLSELVEGTAQQRDFRPPFLPLGPAALPLYESALRQGHPGATAPAGLALVFERIREGATRASWLAESERNKLEHEAQSGLAPRLKKHTEALAAMERLNAG